MPTFVTNPPALCTTDAKLELNRLHLWNVNGQNSTVIGQFQCVCVALYFSFFLSLSVSLSVSLSHSLSLFSLVHFICKCKIIPNIIKQQWLISVLCSSFCSLFHWTPKSVCVYNMLVIKLNWYEETANQQNVWNGLYVDVCVCVNVCFVLFQVQAFDCWHPMLVRASMSSPIICT